MARCFRYSTVSRRIAAIVMAVLGISLTHHCLADAANSGNDAFYHQLLKLPESRGYVPTRSFTIVVDTEHGNQLVAEDDPNLAFNQLWMEQFKPGYRANQGGAVFGEVFRSYIKQAYKAYREQNAQRMAALPDEDGSIHAKRHATNLIDAMDYNLKVTDEEVRLKIQYKY